MSDVVCKVIRNHGARGALKAAKWLKKPKNRKLVPPELAGTFWGRLGALDEPLIAGYTEAFDWLGMAKDTLVAGEKPPPPPWA